MLNSYNNPVRQMLALSLFYQGGNWGIMRLSNLLKVTQLLHDRGWTWSQAVLLPSLWRRDADAKNLRNTLAPIIAIKKKFLLYFQQDLLLFYVPVLCAIWAALLPLNCYYCPTRSILISFWLESQHTCLKLLHTYLKHEYPLSIWENLVFWYMEENVVERVKY